MNPWFSILITLTLQSSSLPVAEWIGPVSPEARYQTAVPFTYVIGYHDWQNDAASMASIRESPPDLLHVNQPIPMNGSLGLTEKFFDWQTQAITPEQYADKVRECSAFVQQMHAAGVRAVIPYVNACIMIGDHERRLGFWKVYDAWESLGWLNLGSKPSRDPLAWCGVPRRSLDPYKPYPEYDLWRYEPSLGDPDWRRFQVRVVEELAACGYDGVFLDDCIMKSRSPIDEERFVQYVAQRPSAKILGERTTLGHSGQGLQYAESIRYWFDTTAEHIEALQQAGRRFNPRFFIIPNWGSISRPMGLIGRESEGKSLESWSRATRLIMLEESYGPGRLATGVVHDFALPLKQCLALGVRPALLPYLPGRLQAELALAEITAGGGGAYVETSSTPAELRKAYQAFYDQHADLLRGLRPWSQVALLYDTDEVHFEHDEHIRDAMRMARALLDAHVQFDVILKKDLTQNALSRYETVVIPNVSSLSDAACQTLLDWVKNGGRLLATGEIATHDDMGLMRPRHAWGLRPYILRGMVENDREVEKGSIQYTADLARLVPATPMDVEMLMDIMSDGIEETMTQLKQQPAMLESVIHPIWKKFVSRYEEAHFFTDASPEIRIHVYQRDDGLLILHLVHYGVSPWETGVEAPPPVKRCRIELTLDESHAPKAVYALDPRQGKTDIAAERRGSRLTLETHDLGFHRMIVVQF